ncbi:benenodin family lasso peptide [Dyella sp. S184]|nr:benenodin family lasso peptide [Dyella sp. S184]
MNTNENILNNTPEDVVELGVASVETQGPGGVIEPTGLNVMPGISEE